MKYKTPNYRLILEQSGWWRFSFASNGVMFKLRKVFFPEILVWQLLLLKNYSEPPKPRTTNNWMHHTCGGLTKFDGIQYKHTFIRHTRIIIIIIYNMKSIHIRFFLSTDIIFNNWSQHGVMHYENYIIITYY